MTTKLIRCAIYTRKSSEEGLEQDFNSLHAQREAAEAFIKSQKHEGWQQVKTSYDDGGYSGGTMNRPALQALLKDIEAGKIDVVVVYKVDRLSRSLHDFAKMVEVFDRCGVSFVSVTQSFNTTSSMGRLTLNMLLSFAQFEREVTAERIRDKVAASKKKGMWMGGHVPLGYDSVDKKLVINANEAETVRHIFTRYLELSGVRELRDELKAKGIRSKARASDKRPGGLAFSRGSLYHLLANPLYAGHIAHKGNYHIGQHEAIIDRELWDKVQQRLASNRAGIIEQSRKTEAGSLHGKLFDAETGEALVVVHANKKGRRYRYYIARSLKTGIKADVPNGWRLPGQGIEARIFSIAQAMLKDRNAIMDACSAESLPSHHMPALLARAHEAAQSQVQVLGTFLTRVELRHDTISVTLSLSALMPPELVSSNTNDGDITITRDTPMQIKRRGVEMRLVIAGGMASVAVVDTPLMTAIARAHAWSNALLSGTYGSMADIAQSNNVSESYVKKLMPLGFLAPDIVAAITAGKQPAHLTTQMLIRNLKIPHDWQEQRQALGFNA